MFGVDSGELFIIILVAVVVIGPKELPRVMRTVGQWVGRARGMANQFRSGVDQMMRDSEIEELEKKWREQNDAIMRAHPAVADSDWGLPPQPPTSADPVPLEAGAGAAPLLSEPAAAAAPREEGRGPAPRDIPPLVRPARPVPRSAGEAA